MPKRKPYRIHRVVRLDVERLMVLVRGRDVVVGIDVAKEGMVAALMLDDEEVVATVGWKHPVETDRFVTLCADVEVHASSVELAMEPSGTYGDALRYQLLEEGFSVSRVSPKQSRDASEMYDGVPSSHDGKSAAIVAWLHLRGKSAPWPVKAEFERLLKASLGVLEMHSKQFHANRNRLGGLLARYWPELTGFVEASSATCLELLSEFGGPAGVAEAPRHARALMLRVSRGALAPEKVEGIIASAKTTLGMAQLDGERAQVQAMAAEARRNQRCERQARRHVAELAASDPVTCRLKSVIGGATAAVVVASAGSPLEYDSPGALVKSLGLNLKERRSGKQQEQGLHLTKRGSGMARKYLYMATLRLLMAEPVMKAWYLKKVERDGGRAKVRAVVAVMRKLVMALWHVARGAEFDARKLYDVRRLEVEVRL